MASTRGTCSSLPGLLVLAVLILYPLIDTVRLSVTDEAGAFVGTENFADMLSSRATKTATYNTFFYVGFSILFSLIFGTVAGILLDREFRGRGFVRSILLIPWIVPGIVAATTWSWMFHDEFGIINYGLQQLGVIDQPLGWLTDATLVKPSLIAVDVWKMFPFVALMVLATLQGIPTTLYEAAKDRRRNFPARGALHHAAASLGRAHLGDAAPADLGLQRRHHRLCDDRRRSGEPLADPADPHLQGGFRSLQLQRRRRPVAGALRRALHRDPAPGPGSASAGGWRPMVERSRIGAVATYCLALIFSVIALFPFAWMALSSVKPLPELYTVPPTWIPENFSLDNYRTVLFELNIPRYFLNSVIISVGATSISIVLAALAAYGFARFRFRGRDTMQASILISQLLPTATIIVPLYILLRASAW